MWAHGSPARVGAVVALVHHKSWGRGFSSAFPSIYKAQTGLDAAVPSCQASPAWMMLQTMV
ncbi:MAG: hypothetical protein R2856_26670 [Caldilineaceae bacterium]